MSNAQATNDWPVPDAPAAAGADDFVVSCTDAAVAPVNSDANVTERAASGFEPIPPGTHEVYVAGFKGAPTEQSKVMYVEGRQATLVTHMIEVRLAMVDAPNKTALDFFLLPPPMAEHLPAYFHGMSKADGKVKGWHFLELKNFLAAISMPWADGQPYPPEARVLKDWKGRKCVATFAFPKADDSRPPKIDATTGEPIAPYIEVKPFSYAPVGAATTAANGTNGATQGKGGGAAAPPAPAISVSDL